MPGPRAGDDHQLCTHSGPSVARLRLGSGSDPRVFAFVFVDFRKKVAVGGITAGARRWYGAGRVKPWLSFSLKGLLRGWVIGGSMVGGFWCYSFLGSKKRLGGVLRGTY